MRHIDGLWMAVFNSRAPIMEIRVVYATPERQRFHTDPFPVYGKYHYYRVPGGAIFWRTQWKCTVNHGKSLLNMIREMEDYP